MERTAVILAVFAILAHVQLSSQQGLVSDPNAVLRASGSYDTLKIIYGNVKAFKRAFQQGAASTTCTKSCGSLCSPYGQTYEQKAAVLVATSPQSFDARSTGAMGSFSAVAQPKAAQSAMACALRQDASSSMSEQDFLFCKSVSPDEERSCGSSWSMRDGIQALTSLQNAKNYPVIENCLPWSPTDPNPCSYQCDNVQQQLKLGRFTYKKLESAWEMQEHIRNWGSVVTRLEIYSDFKPFFAKNPAGIYPGHGPSASKVTSHAIQVVGYDLESQPQSWLCKNSWGTGFAAGGFFRIAFGADGVGSPDDTYGIKFVTAKLPSKPYNRLTKGPGGCFYYRALPTDFVSRVAYVFNSSPSQILLDNKDIIRQPDILLTDMTILLCGISVPQQSQGSGDGNGGSSKPSPAVEEKPPPKQSPPSSPHAEQPQTRPRPQPQPPKIFSNVKAGIYKGKVACEGANMDATFTVPQAPGGDDEFELEIYSHYQAGSISCDYHAKATCLPWLDEILCSSTTTVQWAWLCPRVTGLATLCGTGQEPWDCVYTTLIKWPDTCAGFARPQPDRMNMCSSAGAFTVAGETKGCKNFTGVVQLVGRRGRSAM